MAARRNPGATPKKLPDRPTRPLRRTTDDLTSALRYEVFTVQDIDPELQRTLDEATFSSDSNSRIYKFTDDEQIEASFSVIIGPMTARHCLDYKALTGGRDFPADLEMLIRWQALMNKSQASTRALETMIAENRGPIPPQRPIFERAPETPDEEKEQAEANAEYEQAMGQFMQDTSETLTKILQEENPDLTWMECMNAAKAISTDPETGEITLLMADRPFNGSVIDHANYICAYMLSRYGRVHRCRALAATSLAQIGVDKEDELMAVESITPDDILDVVDPDMAFAPIISPHHLDEDGNAAEMSLFLYLLERTGLWTHQKMSTALGVPLKKAMGEGQEFGLTRSSVKQP